MLSGAVLHHNNFPRGLQVALGVIAGGADFGGLGAHHDVAAVAALPHFYFALGKHFCHFNVVQQGAVALFVMLFNGSHQAEPGSQFGEALFLSRLGKAVIHIGPFVIFARGGGFQVVGGIADAVQLLEPQLGMFFFRLSAVFKNSAAICSKPCFLATEAKKVYLLRASDSPANAVIRFSSLWYQHTCS